MINIEKSLLYVLLLSGIWGAALNSFSLGPFHFFLFRCVWVVLVATFLIRLIFFGKLISPGGISNKLILFFFLWFLYASASSLWVSSFDLYLNSFVLFFVGLSLVFLIPFYARSSEDCYRIFMLWVIMVSVFVVLGAWEVLIGTNLPVSKYYGIASGPYAHIPTAVFRNPNDFATFLAISFPFLVSLYKYGGSRISRLNGLILSVLVIAMIGFTGSRANMIAVMVGGVFFFLFSYKPTSRVMFLSYLTFFVAASVFLFTDVTLAVLESYKRNIFSIIEQAQSGEGSVAVRFNLVLNSLHFLLETYGFGVGLGNSEYWMENHKIYATNGQVNPHNWWIEVLVEFGIAVFAFYCIAYFYMIFKTYRLWKASNNREERMISEAILVALAIFVIASISSSSVMAFRPMWILFGLALANISVRHREFLSRKKFLG